MHKIKLSVEKAARLGEANCSTLKAPTRLVHGLVSAAAGPEVIRGDCSHWRLSNAPLLLQLRLFASETGGLIGNGNAAASPGTPAGGKSAAHYTAPGILHGQLSTRLRLPDEFRERRFTSPANARAMRLSSGSVSLGRLGVVTWRTAGG